MAIATRALRALVSIAWQQVFENLSNYFHIYSYSRGVFVGLFFHE
jgi:hypothetical protein